MLSAKGEWRDCVFRLFAISLIKARLIPPVQFSLEEALEYIKEDEYVEVTPKSMRMRKVILDELERKRANKN